MIEANKDKVHIHGTGLELMKEAVSIVYSLRKEMGEEWVEDFDICLKAILAGRFDDKCVLVKTFKSEEEYNDFLSKVDPEGSRQQPTSLAEGIMRDITEEQD